MQEKAPFCKIRKNGAIGNSFSQKGQCLSHFLLTCNSGPSMIKKY